MDEDEPKDEETVDQDVEQSEEKSTVNRLKEEVVAYFERLRKSGKRLYRDPSDKDHWTAGWMRPLLWWRPFVVAVSLCAACVYHF